MATTASENLADEYARIGARAGRLTAAQEIDCALRIGRAALLERLGHVWRRITAAGLSPNLAMIEEAADRARRPAFRDWATVLAVVADAPPATPKELRASALAALDRRIALAKATRPRNPVRRRRLARLRATRHRLTVARVMRLLACSHAWRAFGSSDARPKPCRAAAFGVSRLRIEVALRGSSNGEAAWAACLAADGRRARQLLTEANLPLVAALARPYANCGVPLADLVQEGVVGLLKAVDQFDAARKGRFTTYAVWWIRAAVLRALARQSRLVTTPAWLTESLARVRSAQECAEQELGRDPTLEEVAKRLSGPLAKGSLSARARRVAATLSPPPVSLDVPRSADDSLLDVIEDKSCLDPVRSVLQGELRANILSALDSLTDREATVLRLRYGLGDDGPDDLADIARLFEITPHGVHYIELRALRKLRSGPFGRYLRERVKPERELL